MSAIPMERPQYASNPRTMFVTNGLRKVILIDDSKTVAAAVTGYFKNHDFEVHVPRTFVQIPALLEEHDPAAIILDLNMPSLSGEQVGQYLRRNNYHGPVIIYSSEASVKLAAAAEKIGAIAFISKDSPLEALLSAVQGAVRAL